MKDKFRMSVEDNIGFAKRMIVDSIYREAQVEGINVTFPETQQVYDGITIDSLTYEETTKIVNLKRAWYFIFDSLEYPFDFRYLRHLNSIIENNLIRNAGMLREITVRISGTDWIPEIPTHESIENTLRRIRQIDNATERSLELMLAIMRGQYFEDGNKRTAQLAANQELIKHGGGIISIPADRKEEFSELLVRFYETGNHDEIMDFLYAECISGFERKREIPEEEIERQRMEDSAMIESFILRKKRQDSCDG